MTELEEIDSKITALEKARSALIENLYAVPGRVFNLAASPRDIGTLSAFVGYVADHVVSQINEDFEMNLECSWLNASCAANPLGEKGVFLIRERTDD